MLQQWKCLNWYSQLNYWLYRTGYFTVSPYQCRKRKAQEEEEEEQKKKMQKEWDKNYEVSEIP